jgi:FAD/FMN-containing dehydrogenase/Fe-S oxidoreductase
MDLASHLSRALRGEVRFDAAARAMYATDASNYRQTPIGVVYPVDERDVAEAVRLCREHDVPILPRGGGTSLAGQCCNVAVVFDFSRHMNRILAIDPERRVAAVEPGVVLDRLRDEAEKVGLTFGPDPSTHLSCTLGGMLGNNSCGIHSLMSGRTSDCTEELEVLTYDGRSFTVGRGRAPKDISGRLQKLVSTYAEEIRRRFPRIPRRVSGYNLDDLLPERGFQVARSLVGTEGTCALILRATVSLVPSPRDRRLVALPFPSIDRAADKVPEILRWKPIGLEAIDARLAGDLSRKGFPGGDLLPEGGAWLLVEFDGEPPIGRALAPDEARKLWTLRESALGATARVPGRPDGWEGWEDAAVAPERLGDYLRDFRTLLDRLGFDGAIYGHFGEGCVHARLNFRFDGRDHVARFREFVERAADLVVRHGGSLSGEHGDGQARAELLPKMFGPDLVNAFREFKSIWDPRGRMNPGKVVDPLPLDANLRTGARRVASVFKYPDDEGRFDRGVARCVGVGKCRRESGGVMCPSYMVTKDETHSTRGRARLLWEMLNGETVRSWRDEGIKEALDLCLSCKGCLAECPLQVDMATYKAEFLSRYYQGRLRPRSAYAFGLIHLWARVASHMPGLVNAILRAPLFGPLAKWAAGIHPARQVPRFALSFRTWFANRRSPSAGERVILWPDTFTNHFQPWIAQAAVEVLEHAGFRVELPPRPLCCGRPLYDFGMVNRARSLLARTLETLRPALRDGVPIVGLEPSCVATFRHEARLLFPEDEDARRLGRQSFLLGEFLGPRSIEWPRLTGRALIQPHCHQRALVGIDADRRLLESIGLSVEIPDAG